MNRRSGRFGPVRCADASPRALFLRSSSSRSLTRARPMRRLARLSSLPFFIAWPPPVRPLVCPLQEGRSLTRSYRVGASRPDSRMPKYILICLRSPGLLRRFHAWNDGFYAVVSARRESVSGASKRYVFTAVGRSGLGLHFPFSGIFTQPPPFWLWLILLSPFAQILLH